jgi:hypothetical protein
MLAAVRADANEWDSASLGLDDAELRDYFGALRESIA